VYWRVKVYADVVRIGELAARSGTPVKTIRYYEEIGVLGAPARTPAGYREYEPDAVDRLAFVRAGQSVGLTLGEIREIVALRDRGQIPCEHVAELIDRRAGEIEARIADLQRLQRDLRQLARRARSLDPADCEPGLVCRLLAPPEPRQRASARN
jgi:DNA-binding transcriptional MerR regulator